MNAEERRLASHDAHEDEINEELKQFLDGQDWRTFWDEFRKNRNPKLKLTEKQKPYQEEAT